MPTIYGTLEAPDRLRVMRVQGKDNPDKGHVVDWSQIPYPRKGGEGPGVAFPPSEPGVNHIMYFNPEKPGGAVWFEPEERPWTAEEIAQHKVPALEQDVEDLKQAAGVGKDNPGVPGIAKRLDDLEARIAALEQAHQ